MSKQIINGKLYNTDTAKYIGHWDNGEQSSSFHYYGEDLYQKKNGEFFLERDGIPQKMCGDTVFGSELGTIEEDDARKWIERHLSADVYIELFGEVEE